MWEYLSVLKNVPSCQIFYIVDLPIFFNKFILFQVCENLGIANESDYFGLKYTEGKNKDLWVNLRNPLASGGTGHGPHRLAMKVKFWVPPHLILQETTRHQFFIQARQDLSDGLLIADDWNVAAKLLALIAQADSIKPHHVSYEQYGAGICVSDGSQKPADFMQQVLHEHRDCKVSIYYFQSFSRIYSLLGKFV